MTELDAMDYLEAGATAEEIAAKIIELQLAYDIMDYKRNRVTAYAQLNQDEMRYDDLVNSTTTWQDAIAAIKAKYPKPEEQRMAVDTTSWKEIT